MNAPERLREGIAYGMPADVYHDGPEVSASAINAMARSPRHCFDLHVDPDRPQQEPTRAMRAGTLTHCAVLEPDQLLRRYAVRPPDVDLRTKAGKAWAEAIAADGREVIDGDEFERVRWQRLAVASVPELAHALGSGAAEVSAFWTDERTGLRCRCRPDWLHTLPDGRAICVDLKTTEDASPDAFSRSVWKWGYHRQQAHYVAGLQACGIEVAAFIFAVVTNARPFIAVPYLLDDAAVQRGADERMQLLDRYAECRRTGEWPAYGAGVKVLSLPAWARFTTEDIEA